MSPSIHMLSIQIDAKTIEHQCHNIKLSLFTSYMKRSVPLFTFIRLYIYATFLVIFKNTVPKSQESQENPLVLCRNKKLPLLESDLVKQG